MEIASITQDYHAMASLKLEKMQGFKLKADEWFDAGKIDEIIKYIETNLVSDIQNDQIFPGKIEDYMNGDTLISRELLQEHLDPLMETCTVRMSTQIAKMQGSWKNDLFKNIQKPFGEIDQLAMKHLESHIIKTERENLQEENKILEAVKENLEEVIMSLPSSMPIVQQAQFQITGHELVFTDEDKNHSVMLLNEATGMG